MHLTETCDQDGPKLITNVETHAANEQDVVATESIHHALHERQLLPSEHIVDTAYTSGAHLVTSQEEYGINLIGPVLPDTSWQARAGEGFDITHFQIDWETQTATCPQGHTSSDWQSGANRHGKPVVNMRFKTTQCRPCPVRTYCTRNATGARSITVRPQKEHDAIQHVREWQHTPAFKDKYAVRAGVEGVISQAAYVLGMRRARYRGFTKTHLQHLVTATAINLKRTMNWLMGVPCATTRTTRFATLRVAPA